MMLANSCAATGIAYALWLRMRWIAIGMAIYMAALAVAVQLFPSTMFIGLIGTFPLTLTIAKLLTVFTLGPADLGVRGSGFPKHMMVLPLRTQSLVRWPMIYGTVTMAALWILVASLILRQAGVPVPVLWPAALGAAGTAWLQAIGWSPFPSPFARVPALALALTPLILLAACASGIYFNNQLVSTAIVAASLAWILVAYLFAVHGLARARAGSESEWLHLIVERRVARIRKRYAGATNLLPRFGSPFKAQLWHECRRNAMALPLMITFVGLPLIVMVISGVLAGDSTRSLLFGSVELPPAIVGLLLLVCMFPLLSGFYGSSLGKFDIWGKEQMPSFFAIRPMATSRFIVIKMIGAAISVLVAWGIIIALMAVWAIVEASSLNPRQSFVKAALAQASPREAAICFAMLLGLLAISWRQLVNGMWPSLTGRKWLAVFLGILSMAVFTAAGVAGSWIYNHPEVQPRLIAWVPWLIGILVAVKLAAAAWTISALHKHRIVSLRTMRLWFGGWVAGCISLFTLLSFLVSPTPMLAAGVVLVLPFTRLAAAPLALQWNRHR